MRLEKKERENQSRIIIYHYFRLETRDCQFAFTLESVCNVHIPKRYRSLIKRISLPICSPLQNGTSLEPECGMEQRLSETIQKQVS